MDSVSNSRENKKLPIGELLRKAAKSISPESKAKNYPNFRSGDTVRVHAKIVEGNKERIQVYEGVVIRRQGGNGASATFTVRKISYTVGVERTFYVHSPRIEKIEVVSKGKVRRARLFYLRDLSGKAAKIKNLYIPGAELNVPADNEEKDDVSEETASA